MKLKDVKVGMRVAVLDDNGYTTDFGTVDGTSNVGTVWVDGHAFEAVYLCQVKPKKIVSFETVAEIVNPYGGFHLYCGETITEQFGGKRVRVTIKEIK